MLNIKITKFENVKQCNSTKKRILASQFLSMQFLYNFLIYTSSIIIWLSQFFSKKMKLFLDGRKDVFKTLAPSIKADDKTIWFHCASLGEFEQGVPLMEILKEKHPTYKLVITFFSPSGYEIKKDTPLADVVAYLPLDTPKNSKKFIQLVHPSLAIFIKYEFWPNYLFQLEKNNIKTLLVSGLFRKNQLFFKSYGGFMRKALKSFNHFFVQDESSVELLQQINFNNITLSGDTRFDRVFNQLKQDNNLDFVSQFKQECLCIVCGSTWPEDENVLIDYINSAPLTVKFIIAPHKIEVTKIDTFRKTIKKKVILFSEKENNNLSEYSVLIIDTIGLLTKIYSYADIAYVGGAMGSTGLHNILEPITFGVPIVIGKNFKKFPEANTLLELKGLFSVNDAAECSQVLNKLETDEGFRKNTGKIAKNYAKSNIGATQKVVDYISTLQF